MALRAGLTKRAGFAAPDLTASRVLPPREEQKDRRLEGKTPAVRARRNRRGAA